MSPRHFVLVLGLLLAHQLNGFGDTPDATRFTLPNGLRVRLVPNHDEKKVMVLLGVRAGFFEEPAGVPHVAHIAEHLTVHGAPADSEEAKAVDRWFAAGQANAETLPELMYFDLSVPSDELPRALRVQAGRLSNAQFSEEVLKQEVPRALSEIDFLEQSEQGGTAKFAYCPFVQAALHDQTKSLVKARSQAMTLEDIRAFYRRTFRPDRAMLIVIGDFDPDQVKQTIEAKFGSIPAPRTQPVPRPQPKPGTKTVNWDAATRHLLLAWSTPPASQKDHAALTIASWLLQQRLFADPRLRALAKMPLVTNEIDGLLVVNVQAKPSADLDQIKERVLLHTARLAKPEGVSSFELTQLRYAIPQLMGTMRLTGVRLPPNVSLLMALGNTEIQKMAKEIVWGDLDTYSKRCESIKAGDINKAAGELLDTKKAIIVRVEPVK